MTLSKMSASPIVSPITVTCSDSDVIDESPVTKLHLFVPEFRSANVSALRNECMDRQIATTEIDYWALDRESATSLDTSLVSS